MGCAVKDGAGNSPSSSPDEGPTQMGTLWQMRHLALTTAEEGSAVRSDWHLCAWIC